VCAWLAPDSEVDVAVICNGPTWVVRKYTSTPLFPASTPTLASAVEHVESEKKTALGGVAAIVMAMVSVIATRFPEGSRVSTPTGPLQAPTDTCKLGVVKAIAFLGGGAGFGLNTMGT
jgi:hypothetical protein